MSVTFRKNTNGPLLGSSSVPFIEKDGLFFRDLERTGELVPYADWRLSARERAEDLVSRLTIEEIAGLMMYSPHQMVPCRTGGPFRATYGGRTFEESGVPAWTLTDQQESFLKNDHVRHVLVMAQENPRTAALWNNAMQSYVEALPHAIPINFSSDPRHGAGTAAAEYKSGNGDVSKWPEGLGLSATFSTEICAAYGEAVRREYRALGITTALSPQFDLGTEPRWMRVEDTFGPNPDQVRDMGRTYCDALQTTPGVEGGWGSGSVCAMAKHWPGGGPCESGRDAHYAYGKFSVYPGENFDTHLRAFTEGALKLNGPTGCVASIMPYYSVSYDQTDENVGNSYNRFLIDDLLRRKYGFDGVVCTDWGITGDPIPEMDSFGSRCFGVEDLTEAQRHLRIIENGVDQFGGNSDIRPILEAYRMGCEKYGEEAMRKRFEESGIRLLINFFRCGLFENPFLDPEESVKIVGCAELSEQGFAAQLKSIVMVKNNGVLPVAAKKKVYIPDRHIAAHKGFFRNPIPDMDLPGADKNGVNAYFECVDTPEEADFALIFAESPISDGYSREDRENGGNGYRPISLQYRPYRADTARAESIGQGDFREIDHPNRSYRGKVGTAANERDLDNVIETKKRMGDKPVIVSVRVHHPLVLTEMEPYADAILVNFGVQQEAVLKTVCGENDPSGRLPVVLPRDMETVEAHCEDKPFDYAPYVDSEGNAYDYGFGLSYDR